MRRGRIPLSCAALAIAIASSGACDGGERGGGSGLGGNGSREVAGGGLTVLNLVDGRPFFDFGVVGYGQTVEHVFRFRNDDGVPVTVKDLLASCGCATPRIAVVDAPGGRIEGRPSAKTGVITIPAGATAELTVKVDTVHVQVPNIDKLATVRMRSDSPTTPYLTFEVHLVVDKPMRAVPAAIELGRTPQGTGKSGRTDVMNDVPGRPARVTGIASVVGPFTATLDATEVSGIATWVLVATAQPDLPLGPATGKVILATTGPDGTGVGAPFEVPVTAQIVPEVVIAPPVLQFGSIAKGTAARVEAEIEALVPGERVKVGDLVLDGLGEDVARWIAAEATPVDPDEHGRSARWTIALQSWPKLEAPSFSGTLVVELDHPKVKELRAAVTGGVK